MTCHLRQADVQNGLCARHMYGAKTSSRLLTLGQCTDHLFGGKAAFLRKPRQASPVRPKGPTPQAASQNWNRFRRRVRLLEVYIRSPAVLGELGVQIDLCSKIGLLMEIRVMRKRMTTRPAFVSRNCRNNANRFLHKQNVLT